MGTDHVFQPLLQPARASVAGIHGLSLVFLLLALLLAGCGFQLRGSSALPAAMSVTCIKGIKPFGTLADDFAEALRLRNIQVTDHERNATAILSITQNKTEKLVVSVDSSGKVQEYEIRQTIQFSVMTSDQKEVVPEQSVVLSRDYIFSSTDVLGKQREEQVVRATLQQNLVNLAMLRISAVAR
jgi:LPS-assembly lipoprotein